MNVLSAYLERLHPEPALYPLDAGEYARALFLEEYADTRMGEVCGSLVFERLVKPQFLQQEPDADRVRTLEDAELPEVCDYLESQLGRNGEWLCASFSIADCAVGSMLASLAFIEYEIDPARWPDLAQYAETLAARDSFRVALTK